MANALKSFESTEFLFGMSSAVDVNGTQVAVNDLNRFVQPAGRFSLPYFAETAATDPFDQPIARNRLAVGFDLKRHGCNSGYTGPADAAGADSGAITLVHD